MTDFSLSDLLPWPVQDQPEPEVIPPDTPLPKPRPDISAAIDPYELLASRGVNLATAGVDPQFADRLSKAILAAEAATGERSVIRDLYRPPERQAQYYANYTQRPVTFEGVHYEPQEKGGLAAAPGSSRHGYGLAADIQRGAILEWLHKNAGQYGLEFLRGNAYSKDPVHIQMAAQGASANPRTIPVAPSSPADAFLEATTQSPEQDKAALLRELLREQTGSSDINDAYDLQDELAALLQPDVREYNSGVTPIWPPNTNAPTTLTQLAALPPDQQPSRLMNLIESLHGAAPGTLDPNQVDRTVVEPWRQTFSTPLEQAASLPYSLAAGIPAAAGLITGDPSMELTNLARGLTQAGQENAAAVRDFTGASDRPNLNRTVMASISPMGKYTLPTTALMAGLNNYLPNIQQTGNDLLAGVSHTMDAAINQPFLSLGTNPDGTHTVETVGGPKNVKENELLSLGSAAFLSAGAMFAPGLYSRMKFGNLIPASWKLTPSAYRQVQEAPRGTIAASTIGDLFRTADDANAGALRLAAREGVPEPVLERLQQVFRVNTRASVHTMAQSAVDNGRMETPNYTFNVPVALNRLADTAPPEFREYMHAWSTLDDILQIENGLITVPGINPRAGPVTVRGMTEQDAINVIRAHEAANPELRTFLDGYKANLRETQRFTAAGEYAIQSRADMNFNNANNAHMIPTNTDAGNVTYDQPIELTDPFAETNYWMRNQIRRRLENEAKGQFIDAVRRANSNIFTRVATDDAAVAQGYPDLRTNPTWKKNSVTIMRRGVPETYVTDPFLADVLKLDPWAPAAGQMDSAVYATKRLFEMSTTGMLAPWFALTNPLRNWQISKFTTPEGYQSPTLLGTTMAVPQQLYPQMARVFANAIEDMSGGWIGQTGLGSWLDSVSLRLAKAYDDSLFAATQAAGTHQGSTYTENLSVGRTKLADYIRQATPSPIVNTLDGLHTFLNAMHNAPQFDFIKKNTDYRGILSGSAQPRFDASDLVETARQARELTGDPHIGGIFYTDQGPIRFEPYRRRNDLRDLYQTTKFGVTHTYGALSELGREVVPWFNQTEQGMKRLAQAYLDNPYKFVGNAWLYMILPTAMIDLYNRSAGTDPNGMSYSDYQHNRRSDYNTTMNHYIALPGQPASQGIEWPSFHEGLFVKRGTEIIMDHMLGSSMFNESEDFKNALDSWLGIVADIPTPPALAGYMATQGYTTSSGLFSGKAYNRFVDPFDQMSGLPPNIEKFVRAVAPGLATITGNMAAAYNGTPEDVADYVNHAHVNRKGVKAAAEAGIQTVAQRAPILRNAFNQTMPMTGNTNIVDMLAAKEKSLNELIRHFETWDKPVLDRRGNPIGPPGLINTKPGSNAGGILAEQATAPGVEPLGPDLAPNHPGINQPPATNPLYIQFMSDLRDTFRHDGVIGYRSLLKQYATSSTRVRDIRKVNPGNYGTWQMELQQKPDVLSDLNKAGVDSTDVRAVEDFYQTRRQNAARIILFTLRNVENQLSKKAGRRVRLEDLKPYTSGNENPESDYNINDDQ